MGIAPHGADGLDWFDGMAHSNVMEFTAAANGYEDIVAHTKAVAERGPGQPGQPDRQAPGRTARPGPAGRGRPWHPVHADRDLCRGPADFRLRLDRRRARVLLAVGLRPGHASRFPVLLWHGASDVFSPASHARWLADRIPGAAVVVQAGAAHFGALDVLPDILRWLSAASPGSQRAWITARAVR